MVVDGSGLWPNVERMRSMGLDPLKWIAGCSIEVDREDVLYPAAEQARGDLERLGATLLFHDGPAPVERRSGPLRLERAVVSPGGRASATREAPRANPNRAVLTLRASQRTAADPRAFAPFLLGSIARLPAAAGPGAGRTRLERPINITRLHAVAAARADAEFALFDLYDAGAGEPTGYTLVVNQSLQVTDAALPPEAEAHVAAAATAALNPLFGSGAVDEVRLYPTFDAPEAETREAIRRNFAGFATRHGVALADEAPLSNGRLFVGATATATTPKEAPNRHLYVERGMGIMITRPFGDLAPLGVRLSCLAEPDYLARLEGAGLALGDLAGPSESTVKALTSPARAAGSVIAEFLPPFGAPPELSFHLAATADLAGRGLLALGDFAETANVELSVREVPLAYPAFARFATAAALIENATANATGAFALVAFPRVLDAVEAALRAKGEKPHRIGEVTGKGQPALRVPPASRDFVGSPVQLRRLVLDEGLAVKA